MKRNIKKHTINYSQGFISPNETGISQEQTLTITTLMTQTNRTQNKIHEDDRAP